MEVNPSPRTLPYMYSHSRIQTQTGAPTWLTVIDRDSTICVHPNQLEDATLVEDVLGVGKIHNCYEWKRNTLDPQEPCLPLTSSNHPRPKYARSHTKE